MRPDVKPNDRRVGVTTGIAAIVAIVAIAASFMIPSPARADDPPAKPTNTGRPQPQLQIPIGPAFPTRPNEGRYDLERTADGGYHYRDIRFDARVAPDGHVTFTDAHMRLETRVLGIPLRKYERGSDGRPSLAAALRQVLRGDPDRPLPACVANNPYRNDPQAPLTNPHWCPPLLAVVGTFDLTDEVMKATGQGWYRFEKAKFLSATFEFRIKLAVERHRKLLREALAELPTRLDGLWNDPGYSQREKKRILCLLWSEVELRDPQASAAADIIVSWIGARLPAGSSAGYSQAEIAACGGNGDRAFAPYPDHHSPP